MGLLRHKYKTIRCIDAENKAKQRIDMNIRSQEIINTRVNKTVTREQMLYDILLGTFVSKIVGEGNYIPVPDDDNQEFIYSWKFSWWWYSLRIWCKHTKLYALYYKTFLKAKRDKEYEEWRKANPDSVAETERNIKYLMTGEK